MDKKEKKIEVCYMKAMDIKTNFGNPRKISKEKKQELKESLEKNGDFGIFLIDEQDNVIAGNQRLAIINSMNPEQELLCKRLIGYTEAELRAINIKDNTHSGEWDLELLANWTADLNLDLGDLKEKAPEERTIEKMELIHYEKYDYVLIACRSELDYNDLLRKLDIEDKKVVTSHNVRKKGGGKTDRLIKARAVWYDKINEQIIEKKVKK